MTTATLVAGSLAKIGRGELAQIPVPQAIATHRPVPYHEIVEALVETLSFRHIGVVDEECAVSSDGMKMFGVLDLQTQMEGCRFAIGIRNSHDKSLRPGTHRRSACVRMIQYGLQWRLHTCNNVAIIGPQRRQSRLGQKSTQAGTEPQVVPDASHSLHMFSKANSVY
jgi:hypothetical protein